MRVAWVEALVAAGVPEGRLQRARHALASQLEAVSAAGLTPSQLRSIPQVDTLHLTSDPGPSAHKFLLNLMPHVTSELR